MRQAGQRLQGGEAGDVDDAAPAGRQHHAQRRPAAVGGAVEVDAAHGGGEAGVLLGQRAVGEDSGVVDPDVQPPVPLDGGLGEAGGVLGPGDVSRDGQVVLAEPGGGRAERLALEVGDDHPVAGGGEPLGEGEPETPGPSGDDGDGRACELSARGGR